MITEGVTEMERETEITMITEGDDGGGCGWGETELERER